MSESRERTAFGARMLAARNAKKLTQEQVCQELGISQGTLSGLERSGQGSVHAAQFARLYDVDPHWLSTGEGASKLQVEEQLGPYNIKARATPLEAALTLVLDAMATAPARAELRTLLQMLVDADSPHYRQRLLELLAAKADAAASAFVTKMNNTAPVPPIDVPLRGLSVKPPPPVDQSAPPSEAGPRRSATGSAAPPSAAAKKARRP